MMVGIARESAPDGVSIDGRTAPFGAPLIVDPVALAEANRAVVSLAPALAADPPDGVIVAGFGDPGLAGLCAILTCPVTGIAEAGMAAAARHGRFVVVTTTDRLVDAIAVKAAAYGHGKAFGGVRLTQGDAAALTADPPALLAALRLACREAIAREGADAIVIGGGPLAVAARALAAEMPVPLIEPVPEAIHLALARAAYKRSLPR